MLLLCVASLGKALCRMYRSECMCWNVRAPSRTWNRIRKQRMNTFEDVNADGQCWETRYGCLPSRVRAPDNTKILQRRRTGLQLYSKGWDKYFCTQSQWRTVLVGCRCQCPLLFPNPARIGTKCEAHVHHECDIPMHFISRQLVTSFSNSYHS